MFGVFWGLFTLFAWGTDNVNKNATTSENRSRAKADGQLTYYGARGNEYLVENNKWVSTKIVNGQEVIADMKTGQIYYNLTEMRKKRKEEEYLKEGKTVRFKIEDEKHQYYYGKYRQPFGLVDIESNIPVDDICINGIRFYISLKDGKILRPIDNYSKENFVGCWNENEIIRIINKRQDEIRNEVDNHDYLWINNNFFYKSRYIYIDSNEKINIWYGLDADNSKYILEDQKLIKFKKEKEEKYRRYRKMKECDKNKR